MHAIRRPVPLRPILSPTSRLEPLGVRHRVESAVGPGWCPICRKPLPVNGHIAFSLEESKGKHFVVPGITPGDVSLHHEAMHGVSFGLCHGSLPSDGVLVDCGSLTLTGLLADRRSLELVGLLTAPGSLETHGLLTDSGSLDSFGLLKDNGSLPLYGLLTAPGSLSVCGLLFTPDSLPFVGLLANHDSLSFVGPLSLPGSLCP